MSIFVRRILIAGVAAITIPIAVHAQVRLSVGAGAGIAASTDGSLSEGRTAPVVTAQLTAMASVIGAGAQVDGWWTGSSSVALATGHLQLHLPSTPLFLMLGAGYGRGDPDGKGTISGTAGHIGAACDIGRAASARVLTLFGNAFLVYAPARSLQMVDGGLAITWR